MESVRFKKNNNSYNKLNRKIYIQKIDKENLVRLIDALPNHIEIAIKEITLNLPQFSDKITEIGIVGVGTTTVCAHILKSFFDKVGRVPVISINENKIPSWISKHTLLFFISFSGNTQEVLSCFNQSIQIDCPSIVITSGGELEKQALQNNTPIIKISREVPYNRTIFGYLLIPLLLCNIAIGYFSYKRNDFMRVKRFLESERQNLCLDVPYKNNLAKQISCKIENRIPLIYTNDSLLDGVILRWQYQFNENAKIPAYSSRLPEMSHNEIIGLCGSNYGKIIKPIFLTVDSPDEDMSERLIFTLNALRKNGYEVIEVPIIGNDELEKVFYGVYLGDYVSYYSAILRGVDPHAVDLIDSIRINK